MKSVPLYLITACSVVLFVSPGVTQENAPVPAEKTTASKGANPTALPGGVRGLGVEVGPGKGSVSGNAATRLRAATKEAPFVNSLGLEFVPLPGKSGVFMARTETRVRDFRAFAKATGHVQTGGANVLSLVGTGVDWVFDKNASWENPGFPQNEDHPVVCVSWEDARALGAWLSKEEAGLTYRLPSDAEWSAALGNAGTYPWGNAWPPPPGAGNYFGKEGPRNWQRSSEWPVAYDYDDGAEQTAPVASYAENAFGFFDLGGNVFEWCEDPYRVSMNDADVLKAYASLLEETYSGASPFRVSRGGSWNMYEELAFRSSYRRNDLPSERLGSRGFRLVVTVSPGG